MSEPIDRRQHFAVSRTIDLTAIIAMVGLFAAGIAAFGGGYWTVTSQQIKLESKFELLDQRLKNDETISADKREADKAFAAEVRANLSQITQAIGDLRTLVASQDVRRR